MLRDVTMPPTKQHGVVLIITLIVLVAMMLASVALTRSVDTSGLIAGNLAFKQSSYASAEVGIETAVTWIETNLNNGDLTVDHFDEGYAAANIDPEQGENWEDFWADRIANQNPAPVTLPVDPAGNTVAYVIHRQCNQAGNPDVQTNPATRCSSPPSETCTAGGSKGSRGGPSRAPRCLYYRVTARVQGPRDTVTFIQSVIASR